MGCMTLDSFCDLAVWLGNQGIVGEFKQVGIQDILFVYGYYKLCNLLYYLSLQSEMCITD
jgi:hypothetical protein